MRTFNNFTVARNIKPNITLTISATGVNTVYTYGKEDIIDLGEISWEMPFTGGMAKTSGYRVLLSNDLSNIKDQLPNFTGAAIQLEVEVNSNVFYPHVGRVRSYRRRSTDPNQIELEVLDKLFDDNPLVPPETLSSSWANVHPEDEGLGYPILYGQDSSSGIHGYPLVVVESDFSKLLGARNMSVTPVIAYTDGAEISSLFDGAFPHGFGTWQAQYNWGGAGSDYHVSPIQNSDFFVLSLFEDIITPAMPRFIAGGTQYNSVVSTSFEVASPTDKVIRNHDMNIVFDYDADVLSRSIYEIDQVLTSWTPKINYVYEIKYRVLFPAQGVAGANSESTYFQLDWIHSDSGTQNIVPGSHHVANSFVNDDFTITLSKDSPGAWVDGVGRAYLKTIFSTSLYDGEGLINKGFTYSPYFKVAAHPDAYKSGRMLALFDENSSFLAVTNNPISILDDVFSNHTLTSFVQEQSSDSAVSANSYFFRSFFLKQDKLTSIVDEYSRITQTNIWVGDSGQLNYRTFQESSNETVNFSLGIDDVIEDTFNMVEAPLGSSIYEQDLFSNIEIKYNYDFQTKKFKNSLIADKGNTADCESIDAIGITKGVKLSTKHIVDADTASLFLGNMVRKMTQQNEFVVFDGASNLFEMEIGDVFHMQNPMIVGSAANYQIIKLATNYTNGVSRITGARLK